MRAKAKTSKNCDFLNVFQCFGGSGGFGIGAKLAMLGHFFAILALSWGSWVQLGSKFGVYGNLGSKLGILDVILVPSRVQNRDLEPKRGPSPLKDLQAEACRGSWSQVGRTLGPSWSQVGPKLE